MQSFRDGNDAALELPAKSADNTKPVMGRLSHPRLCKLRNGGAARGQLRWRARSSAEMADMPAASDSSRIVRELSAPPAGASVAATPIAVRKPAERREGAQAR